MPYFVCQNAKCGDRFFDYKGDYKGQITFFSAEVFAEAVAETEWKSMRKSSQIVGEKPWPYVGMALGLGLATG